ncbi:MAG: transcriptional regulator [Solirubrobacterales bacterium]
MHQVTLRIPDELSGELKRKAEERGESVNAYATFILTAATDPDLEGDEAAKLRARLDRAGLLAEPLGPEKARARPSKARVAAARARAGRGRRLSDLVSEGRG